MKQNEDSLIKRNSFHEYKLLLKHKKTFSKTPPRSSPASSSSPSSTSSSSSSPRSSPPSAPHPLPYSRETYPYTEIRNIHAIHPPSSSSSSSSPSPSPPSCPQHHHHHHHHRQRTSHEKVSRKSSTKDQQYHESTPLSIPQRWIQQLKKKQLPEVWHRDIAAVQHQVNQSQQQCQYYKQQQQQQQYHDHERTENTISQPDHSGINVNDGYDKIDQIQEEFKDMGHQVNNALEELREMINDTQSIPAENNQELMKYLNHIQETKINN